MTEQKRKRVRLGELLVECGVITADQLSQALNEQRRTGHKLGRVLIDLHLVKEETLQEVLSKHLKIPFIDIRQTRLDSTAVHLLPETLARRFRSLVLQSDGQSLLVGMSDPTDLVTYDELALRLKKPLRLALVKEADLLKVLDTAYRKSDEIASLAQEVRDELRESDIDIEQMSAEEDSADAPVIRLLQSMFQEAIQLRASDLHIEPGEHSLRVRQRIDGILQEQNIDGRRVAGALVTRLKLMCGLDIAEKRLPQDGRFSVKVGNKSIDVRLSTMPTQFGESVVMRLLDQSANLMTLEQLGMDDDQLTRFRSLIERNAGLLLVTGPTGSGKTTTLYSALNYLNRSDVKIITVEDPVEYRLDRVSQVQVNQKIGLDFSRVLRTTLRQDPDIILIGEMRDQETVEIGLRAAITGHLVFSTLHTMGAIATVNRLLDMGAAGYMVATALHGIVAQRLVRKICTQCAEPHQPDEHEMAWLDAQAPITIPAAFKQGRGCAHCNLSGYRGRSAVYELLELDSGLTDAIRRSDTGAFASLARSCSQFVSLTRSALMLAARGQTTLSEVIGITSGLESPSDSLLSDALTEADPTARYAGKHT